ncbi:hypothetical protein CMO86_08760 [Candidatus Woesearchaeota archaeon]|nr:hypothetical protein [Candidatus Woesearchaeota archaeon]
MDLQNLKVIVLTNQQILVSQIEEVSTDLGEPDCKLVEPFLICDEMVLKPWMIDMTNQNTFMIHSDKILTIADPNSKLREKYEGLIG